MTETAAKTTTTKKTTVARKVKSVRKSNKGKQRSFTTDNGLTFIVGFPGNAKMDDITDDSKLADGTPSDALTYAAYMDSANEIIIDPEMSFDYFDKLIPAKLRTGSIKITESDGKETSYQFKFPGMENYFAVRDRINASNGSLKASSEWLDASVITTPKIKSADYWDEHAGRQRVNNAAMVFLQKAIEASDFSEVMAQTDSFLKSLQF